MQHYKTYPIDSHASPRGARGDSGWEAVGAVFEPERFETKSVCREVKRFRSGRELFFESTLKRSGCSYAEPGLTGYRSSKQASPCRVCDVRLPVIP